MSTQSLLLTVVEELRKELQGLETFPDALIGTILDELVKEGTTPSDILGILSSRVKTP